MTTDSITGNASPESPLPTPHQVGTWLDTYAVFCDLVLGRSHHAGAWGPDDTPERAAANGESTLDQLWNAQERLVDRLASLLNLQPDQQLLDIGCGTGRTALQLAAKAQVRVTGCTVSRSQVDAANERAGEAGLSDRVSFDFADAMNLPYGDASFDAAWAVESFDHMSDPVRAFSEIRRVLRPGGQAMVSVNSKRLELTEDEMFVWRDGYAVCPPLAPAELAEAARAAGLEVEVLLEPYEDFQVARTWHLWNDLYHEQHEALTEQYGQDGVAMMDIGIATLYSTLTQKIGYAVCVVRKSEDASEPISGSAQDDESPLGAGGGLPTPEDVGAWYDRFGAFFDTAMGRSFHSGIWPADEDLPEAADMERVSLSQERMVDYLVDLLAPQQGGRHLDVGSGTGNTALQLAGRHRLDVTGANISHNQIDEANGRAERAGLADRARFEFADAMDLPFAAESFDTTWGVESFEHISDIGQALREMHRVLKPGGRALVAMMTRKHEMTPLEDQAWQQGFHLCPLPSIEELSDSATAAGFTVEQVVEPQDELRVNHTWKMWLWLYQDSREALVEEYGEEFVQLMDIGCPMILDIYQEKCWYAVFVLRKPGTTSA